MTKSMKKPVSVLIAVLLMLVMAIPAFAATQSYQFYYDDAYHTHSSSYIAGPADITDGEVTITLNGDYFPELVVDGITYYGSYSSSTNLTTFTFPGDNSADIDVTLAVETTYHSTTYDLTIHWV